MFRQRLKKILTAFFSFSFMMGSFLVAQNVDLEIKPRTLNEEEWKTVTKNINYHQQQKRKFYQYETKKIGYNDDFEKNVPPKNENQTAPKLDLSSWSTLLKGFGIVFLVVIGILLIYFFAKNANWKNNKKIEDLNVILSQVEDNLPEADVETPLERAINEQNYKVATRLYYLLLLQKLAEKGNIKWSKEKTNREYTNELHKMHFIDEFRQTTFLYEKAWFGKNLVTQREFEQFQPLFDSLISKVV